MSQDGSQRGSPPDDEREPSSTGGATIPTDELSPSSSSREEAPRGTLAQGSNDTVHSIAEPAVVDGSLPLDDGAAIVVTGGGPRQLAGRTLHERYRLECVMGSGGMGDVYAAHHLNLDMPVAVKVLHPHVASVPEFEGRFRREARAASMLQHRNVVQVIDFGVDDDLLFLVMELLRGESLGKWLVDWDEPPPLAEVQEIFGQVLHAFEAAHGLGVVHRDLKPDNVFLTRESDGERVVKVVDFGLARIEGVAEEGPTITQADVISGTPEFMSPEQCQSLAVGPSTDLYAIGCLLTSLLQLAPPFLAKKPMAVMTRQMFWPPPPLDRPPDAEPVPPLLEQLRLDLLAKSPTKRPQDIVEVRDRFVEAFSAEATERRLPCRKADEPAGSREERLPDWTLGRSDRPEPPSAQVSARFALVRLDDSAQGVTPDVAVGLAAHGLRLQALTPAEAPPDYDYAVVDAGDQLEPVLQLLDRWKAARGPRVLVCANALDTDGMNRLIAAGVGDLVTYPVDVDVLQRKLRRMTRRRR